MSDPRSRDARTPNDFSAVWKRVSNFESKNSQNKLRSTKSGKQTKQSDSVATTSCTGKDLQTPKRRAKSRYTVLNNGDSPGDGEVLQDIIWDPTSPTPANTGKGGRYTRVVEISDIVNRIAPKDAKSLGVDSSLLQWIGDSAVPCTPDIPQPRVRKKSTRLSKVEDLMKLAKQFDMNMQQDKETEQLNKVNNNWSECRNEDAQPPAPLASTSQEVEEELHALFDCSTQGVSGRLSQSSLASSCSQETRGHPGGSASIAPRQSESKSADRKSSAPACPANAEGSAGTNMDKCDDFDDDWEDDELLNDSLVLAMTQNSEQRNTVVPETGLQSDTRLNTDQHPSASKPTSVRSAFQVQSVQPQPSSSGLQGNYPKPKTSNRSTFKLEPNPHFQGKMAAAKRVSASSLTVTKPYTKPQMPDKKSAIKKPVSPVAPPVTPSDQIEKGGGVAPDPVKDIADENMKSFWNFDSLWDDGDDDDLLYQVCDNVERLSNSQPEQPGPSNRQDDRDVVEGGQRKATTPLAIETDWSMKSKTIANRQSACGFVRSNSMPGTSSGHVNRQGWNVPLRGTGTKTNQSLISQSHPGSSVGLGTFGECRNSPAFFQAADANPGIQPRTVTAKPPQNSSSHHHASFKRNLSDSAAISNKVFVTGQMTGKCSAAEIERKKQEALARRRLRMQTAQKP